VYKLKFERRLLLGLFQGYRRYERQVLPRHDEGVVPDADDQE
jgi:hypothetical protein